jgi:uncharacterized RmlC-like cupin family protein
MAPPWKHDGVRVVPANQLDPNTAQTPGMDRQAAISFARVGAQKLWAGTVHIHAGAKTGAHHHGPLESVIYVVKGRARMRWGERLEFTAEAGPGAPRMPLAIVRKQVKDLPASFTLDDSLAMGPGMGLSSAQQVVVGARISRSGQAMPQPGDLEGLSAPVAVGSQGVVVEISRALP